ncbi:MAG: CGNR zinc finger domain-containing protein [Pseudonocardiaceae bacterium]
MSRARDPSALDAIVPLRGEPLALELVNTTFIEGGARGRRVDVLREPEQLDRWLRGHADAFSAELQERLAAVHSTPDQVASFQQLRHALRACLEAVTTSNSPPEAALSVINRCARDAAHWLEIAEAYPVSVVRRWNVRDWMRVAAGEVAAAGCELMRGSSRDRIRACPAAGCILFFVKTHPRREWCSPACGNRVRVARHGQRHRPGASRSSSSNHQYWPEPEPPQVT